ncbi:hypothetical protein IG193_03135 [Infirmifilum lucidum]|uniref:Uncharacterized protein n=1 Tax=Infirmifilum lucidum TaxID=2776706 RepID=A0A7L9FI89_9CREN|nr:hypothetical protein [Infirmifilum lucidum]QOJ79469.1 hypothetical protein IG193_03135 [Infirmifilum lucidum]
MYLRKAISPVIAVTIMTGIMLTIVAVALYYSTSLIDLNRQMMEYQYAKDNLAYAATALEQVALGTGGSRYIRFSLISTRINFEYSRDNLSITITDNKTTYQITPFRPGRIVVCGGNLVTTTRQLIVPESGDFNGEVGKLIVAPGEPIVLVYEDFRGAACAYLETYRVRAFYNGAINVTEGGAVKRYNFYTVHVIRLKLGQLGGSGTIPVIFRNTNSTLLEYRLQGPSVTVNVVYDGYSQSSTLRGPQADGSVVVVKIAEVTVTTS